MPVRRTAFALALGFAGLANLGATRPPLDFAAGSNAEGQPCRAQARFNGPEGARQADLFCGGWERPSGRITVFPVARRAEAETLLRRECGGAATGLAAGAFSEFAQVPCAPEVATTASGVRRFGLIAVQGGQVIVGAAYPADWEPLVQAARVMSGAATATQSATSESPGLREIQSVYPAGPPGQGAEANYELLRRRAYEKNVVWNFGGSQTDFAELLRLHRAVAPDDAGGEAEILGELALNLSGEERFDEAAETLALARTRARQAGDALMLSKLENYRAMDLLNQRRYAEAIEVVQAANNDRSGGARGGAGEITAADAMAIDRRARAPASRSLVFSMGEIGAEERAAVLSAQGYYIAGVAAAALRRPEAQRYLADALARSDAAVATPAWLRAQIRQQMAVDRMNHGDPAGAAGLAQAGLAEIRGLAPATRTEAHLLMTLGQAQRRMGQLAQALATEGAAVAIFAAQRERPGLPGDIAADHLAGLVVAWEQSRDPALAARYAETLSLVWDGAAARSASQLAARLASREASAEARTYQDAERGYRAALARRQRMALVANPDARLIAAADADVRTAAGRQQTAEAALRARSPRFLELLSPAVSAADLAGALTPGEGYLRYVTTGQGGFGVLVTREGITPFRSDLTTPRADDFAQRIRNGNRLRGRLLQDYDLVAAHAVYAAVVGPVAAQTAGLQRLQMDVGGALAAVPFAALVTEAPDDAMLQRVALQQDYTNIPWLTRRVAVAQSVGPASFVRLRRALATRAPGNTASIFGDFRPNPAAMAERLSRLRNLSPQCREEVQRAIAGLQALPDTAGEARQVAGLFGQNAQVSLGDGFTDTRYLGGQDVRDAGVIVLATHGVLSLSSCLAEPALIASLGSDGDGLIEASELLDQQLRARLVVLSACDTAGGGRADVGRSGLSGGGEALSGLARGFLYAGASSVLATQWKVDSATSATEVMAFFQAALQDGQPMAVALQTAQARVYAGAETGHPFYWAAFTLIGDGSTTLR